MATKSNRIVESSINWWQTDVSKICVIVDTLERINNLIIIITFRCFILLCNLFRISHQKDSLLVSLRLQTSSGLSVQSWCHIPAALVLCVGLFPNFTFAPWSQLLSPIGVVGMNSRYWRAAWRSLSGDPWPYMAGLRLHASRRQLLLPLWLPTAEPSVSTVI